MSAVFAAFALLVGYGLWRVMPMVLEWIGLGWTADLGQVLAVILVLSLLGKLEGRLAARADH